jgi:predicted alpha/beta-hydrolase family hydrolase
MAKPLILFAHGAGAPSSSGWMRAWAGRLRAVGDVVTFDYPYMQASRKTPDRHAALVSAHATALGDARAKHRGSPVILAGKSMGSRIGCHLAVDRGGSGMTALVCFGYPLRSGASGALRDEVLRALRTPILFLQGSKDALCPLPDLEQVRSEMTAPNELFVVEGGNHSLEVGVRDLRASGKTQEDWNQAMVAAITRFLAAHGVAPE